MKKISLSLMVSVLAVGLMWIGCGNDGGPLGPEGERSNSETLVPLAKPGKGGGGKGGGGEPVPGLVDLAGGMVASGFPGTVGTDNHKKLGFDSHAPHAIQMNFLSPGIPFQMSKNLDPGDIPMLLAELTALVENGFFTVQIDKAGLSVGGSTSAALLGIDYVGALGGTRIQMGGPYDTAITATWVSHTVTSDGTVDVFEFSGTILVGTTSGGRKNSRVIGCPGPEGVPEPNKVVVTLTR